MDNTNLDLKRFRRLAKKAECSPTRGRFLSQLEYSELKNSERQIRNHHYFENKNYYLELLNDHLSEQTISSNDFKLMIIQL